MRAWLGVAVVLLGVSARGQQGDQGSAGSVAGVVEQPAPDPSGVYKVGHGVSAPKAIHMVTPQYPLDARMQKLQGVCVVDVVVDAAGRPQNVHVAPGADRSREGAAWGSLQKAAVDAVKRYHFQPGKLNGVAVPVQISVEVSFRLS